MSILKCVFRGYTFQNKNESNYLHPRRLGYKMGVRSAKSPV